MTFKTPAEIELMKAARAAAADEDQKKLENHQKMVRQLRGISTVKPKGFSSFLNAPQ